MSINTQDNITTAIYLARHGETEWNKVRRLQGTLNSPLTQAGMQQAEQLASLALAQGIKRIIHSPLGRASETAAIVAKQARLIKEEDQALAERHFGEWQGEYFDSLTEQPHFRSVFYDVSKHAPPKGESGISCGKRISETIKAIANKYAGESLLLISHGDAIRCFLSAIGGAGECDAYSQYGNGRAFAISYFHQSQQFMLAVEE